MITFDYAGDKYELKFYYDVMLHCVDSSGVLVENRERTSIMLGKAGEQIRYGMSVLRHYKDPYDKELGRRYVLAKLFDRWRTAFLDKDFRAAAWKAYFNSKECRKSGRRKVHKEVGHAT